MTALAPGAPPAEQTRTADPPGPLEAFLRDARLDDAETTALWAAMGDATRGGRRMRPALARAAYAAFGGTHTAAVEHVGDAIELLHAAFVMHDDVIDNDQVRRGRPNVAGTFTSRGLAAGAGASAAQGYGRAAGILAGDLALVAATRLVATTPAPPATVARLLTLLDDAVTESAAGELRDVRFALGVDDPSLADVLAVGELKTAAYSFCLPLCAGGILAGVDDATVASLDRLGRLLGIAFQLHDDLLGVFGDERATGKSTLSDLREGKLTVLVAHARTTAVWPRLARHVGDPDLTVAAARQARRLLESSGSRRFVEDLVHRHLDAAHAEAHRAGLPDDALAGVASLIDHRGWAA